MRTVEVYQDVPDGSTLELRVTPANGAFTSTALFSSSGNVPDETWPDPDIRPGARTHALARNHAYMLEVRLAFLGAVQAEIDARIRKPDGSIYSTPKTWTIAGNNGDQALRVLLIRTEP